MRSTTRRRSASSATIVDVAGHRGRRRARPVPAFHAEGDLRAAARGRRHARRHRRHRPDAVRRTRRRDPAAGRFGADPRLRHQLLLEPRGETVDRNAGRHAMHRRDRERIPLPRQRAGSEGAGRRGLAVGRDRRHAGRAEACEVARPRAYARDLQRRDQLDGAANGADVPYPRRHRESASRRPRRSPRNWSRSFCWR